MRKARHMCVCVCVCVCARAYGQKRGEDRKGEILYHLFSVEVSDATIGIKTTRGKSVRNERNSLNHGDIYCNPVNALEC
jgi:hypothetical protein